MRQRTIDSLNNFVSKFNKDETHIINCLLGDSIFEYIQTLIDEKKVTKNEDWHIFGCGGDQSSNLLFRVSHLPSNIKIQNAVILIGINDLSRIKFKNKSTAELNNIYDGIISNIKEISNYVSGCVYVSPILNCNPNTENIFLQPAITQFNARLIEQLQINPKYKILEPPVLEKDDFFDDVHLVDSGYSKLFKMLSNELISF